MSVDDRAHRLRRIGITEGDAQALEHIWNSSRAFGYIADQRAASLAGWGYSALDSLDAIWHELTESEAHLYMQHGFTPHQAFLLDTNRQAQRNLWGPSADTERVHEVLAAPIPCELLTKILLVGESPTETDTLIATITGEAGDDDPTTAMEAATADVEARAAHLPDPITTCNCDI